MRSQGDTGHDGIVRFPLGLNGMRRLLERFRASWDHRRTLRQVRKLPAIVRRDIGIRQGRSINKNELSYQFYSLD